MRRIITILMLLSGMAASLSAQDYNRLTDDGVMRKAGDKSRSDSTKNKNKEVLHALKTWKVDERFGERVNVVPDTVPHMYSNTVHTSGFRGEYNMLGNLGSPRLTRIFADQPLHEQFMFTQPYDFFLTSPGQFHFTNTLSPITNLSFNSCGDKNNGEDYLKALFAINAGKRLGFGFKFNYMYGRGYFQNQSTALFDYTMHGSYLGDRYQAHLLLSTNHMKTAENGGITDDTFVSHPESHEDDFRTDEIPTVLSKNWNNNDNQHVFLTHRYNIGFNRQVPMTAEEIKAKKFAMESKKENENNKKKTTGRRGTQNLNEDAPVLGRPDDAIIIEDVPADSTESAKKTERIAVTSKAMADSLIQKEKKAASDTSWTKNEFVPVTSFIHTLKLDNYNRRYIAYDTPLYYYAKTYLDNEKFTGDSIYDQMKHYNLRNTLAISLLEGFNKWAKAGLKGFVTSDLRHFSMPDTSAARFASYNEHNLSIGGQLAKTQGRTLHYNALLETWISGEDAGQMKLDGDADLNFKLFGDTVRLAAHAHFYRLNPTFFQRHYHAKHLWWDNDLEKETRVRVEGTFAYEKTRTRIRVAMDNLTNYTYFTQKYDIDQAFMRTANTVNVNQASNNISVLTAQLTQYLTFGPLNWESQVTWQKSSDKTVIPVPDLNIYTNLYLKFVISKVLHVELGGDLRYFTKYYAPDYSPYIGQYTVQDNGDANVEIGNYPIVNVYANMFLKHARFYVMMSHVNKGEGGQTFLVPHYPFNERILRLGISWNFFN